MANKRIQGITIELDGRTGKLEEALKGVEDKLRSTSTSLKDIDRLLKLDPTNVELLTQKQKYLEQAVGNTEDKLKQLRTASEEAAKTAGNYDAWKQAHDEVQTEIGDTQAQLNKLKDAAEKANAQLAEGKISQEKYDKIQSEVADTEAKLKALKEQSKQVDDQFGHPISPEKFDAIQREIADTEQQLRGLNDQLSQMDGGGISQKIADAGGKVASVGEGMTAVGQAIMPVSQKLIDLGGNAVDKFAEVDKIMALTVKTMKDGEGSADKLNDAMAKAAANSTFGMGDAANAMLNFARAGLLADEACAALAPAMNLAAGEGGNLDTVSAGLVATINGFGDSFDQTGHYADVFAAACNNSALDVDSLSNSMSIAAPVFRTAGYSVEDAALYLGTMADKGIDANKAANSLKTGLARLVKPPKDAATELSRLDWSITNADGTMKDSITIQKELHDKFKDLSEAEQIAAASAIFGKNQFSPWLALINTAPEDVAGLSSELANCAGTTDEMAEAMMSGFGGSIEKLKSSLDVLMTTLGQTLAEYLQPVIDALQRGVDWLNSLDEGTRRIVVTVGLVVAAIGPLLTTLGPIVTAVGNLMTMAPQLSAFLGSIKGGVSGLLGLIAAHPVAAAIAGVIAAVVLLYNKCEWFRNAVEPIWTAIKTGASGMADFIRGVFKTLGEASELSSFGNAVEYIFWSAYNWVEETWGKLKDFFGGIIGGVKDKVDEKLGEIKQAFTNIFENVKNTVKTAIEKIRGFFNFEWKLPHIPLPHFKVTGELDLLRIPPKVPSLGIDWYRKAMEDGMILTSPTIFPAANGTLRGFGDAGPEAVVGVDSLRGMIQSAVGSAPQLPRVLNVILECDGAVLGRTVYRLNNEETQRVGATITT